MKKRYYKRPIIVIAVIALLLAQLSGSVVSYAESTEMGISVSETEYVSADPNDQADESDDNRIFTDDLQEDADPEENLNRDSAEDSDEIYDDTSDEEFNSDDAGHAAPTDEETAEEEPGAENGSENVDTSSETMIAGNEEDSSHLQEPEGQDHVPGEEDHAAGDAGQDDDGAAAGDAGQGEDETTADDAGRDEDENNAEDAAGETADAELENREQEETGEELVYEDDSVRIKAVLPEGAFDGKVSLKAEELCPPADYGNETDKEELSEEEMNLRGELYASVMEALEEAVSFEGRTITRAAIWDICFVTEEGEETEPNKEVSVFIEHKQDLSFQVKDDISEHEYEDESQLSLLHIPDDGNISKVDADILTAPDGTVEETNFTADSFSLYALIDTNSTAGTRPYSAGEYGWIRFGGNIWGSSSLPGDQTNEAWAKWLNIDVYTLNSGAAQGSHNPSDYTLKKTFSYLATWDDGFSIEDYQLTGKVVWTSFHRAHGSTVTSDKIESYYAAARYFDAWTPGGFTRELNKLSIYLDTEDEEPHVDPLKTDGTAYIIRYYHADGSFDQVDGTLGEGESISTDSGAHAGNDIYSGMTITAGNAALNGSADPGNGSAVISYHPDVRLAKVNVYYKENIDREPGGEADGSPQYDTKDTDEGTVYDTSRSGLHTEKRASLHEDGYGFGDNDGRTFDLRLDAWNVGQNMANVGIVVDASGSMTWTSNTPDIISKTTEEWQEALGTGTVPRYTLLSQAQVDSILDVRGTDNSRLNYNGYQYYVYDTSYSVNEYVALGYYQDGDPKTATFSNYSGTGWYYVNTMGYPQYATGEPYGAKQYVGLQHNPQRINDGSFWITNFSNGQQPVRFYINNAGQLKCVYFFNGRFYISNVYLKADDAETKSEVLQHSIGRFAALLNAMSPDSLVGMTRFSRQENNGTQFSSDELTLLNWTSDTSMITGAMNQEYGNALVYGGASSDMQDGMPVYNYGFTGSTVTSSGIKAFIDQLTGGPGSGYAPTVSNDLASKYLIIFTDGKDTGNEQIAVNYANALKQNGYTIMTVFMRSAGMTSGDVSFSRNFLTTLAGTATESGANYFYEASHDSMEELVAAFQAMATKIASPLEQYVVRDYIDPRFDVLGSDGEVLSVLHDDGSFTDMPFRTVDGKTAILKYDSAKSMFYVMWSEQTIPSSAVDAEEASIWTSIITVRAKEDLIGGNDLLTNGNESGQNAVYDPENSSNPSKDFPKTTANPEVLEQSLRHYEDTLYMGETISPEELLEVLLNSGSSELLTGYLERAGSIIKGDPQYYLNILAGADPGADENVVSDTDKIVITLPYYYLPDPSDDTSYAGGALHQNDRIGTVIYTWEAVDIGSHAFTDGSPFSDYTSSCTDDVRYKLTAEFTPSPVDYGSSDAFENNGTARTRILTGNQPGVTDLLIRDPEGTEQLNPSGGYGYAAEHFVDGRIRVEKRINKQGLLYLLNRLPEEECLEFCFKISRTYEGSTDDSFRKIRLLLGSETGTGSAAASSGETIYTLTKEEVEALREDAGGYISLAECWETGLPVGEYSVSEEITDSDITFTSAAAVRRDAIEDDPVTEDYVELPEFGSAWTADTNTVTWYMGMEHVSSDSSNLVPDSCSYAESDFSESSVVDGIKETDPQKEKNYLNAQIGQVLISNKAEPYFELPASGGPGDYLLLVIGSAVFLSAILSLYTTRRKEG